MKKGAISTTVLAVNRNGHTVFGGDGQVTLGNAVVKHGALKIRRVGSNKVLTGFAGSAADGFTLLERFEKKLAEYSGQLARAAVELAKDWRTDRVLRRLEAMLLVGNSKQIFLLSGAGDVIQPDDGILAIGSGGNYALAAARALLSETKLSLVEIVKKSLEIAAEICPYTNDNFVIEEVKEND